MNTLSEQKASLKLYRYLTFWSASLMALGLLFYYLVVFLLKLSINPMILDGFDLPSLSMQPLFTLLQLELFSLALPWMLLSVHGEWLYSRSVSIQKLQHLMLREYLVWWSIVAVLLVGLMTWVRWAHYSSNMLLSWPLLVFSLAMSLGAGLIMATHGQLSRWQGLALFMTVAWIFVGIDAYAFGYPVGLWFGIGAIILCLISLALQALTFSEYRGVFEGLSQLENKSQWWNRCLRLLPQVVNPVRLQAPKNVRQARWSLLSQPGMGWYAQLSLWVVLLFLLNGLRYLLGLTQDIYHADHLLVLAMFALISVIFNPRYLLRQYQEYFYALPVSRIQLYLTQWVLQAGVLGVNLAVVSLIPWFNPELKLSLLPLALLSLFFWLGGELVIGATVLVLLSTQFSLWLGTGVLLFSQSAWALSLWGVVIGFRLWDLWCFGRQDLQPVGQYNWRRGLRHYALPVLLLISTAAVSTRQLPLTRYIVWETAVDQADPVARVMLAYDAIYGKLVPGDVLTLQETESMQESDDLAAKKYQQAVVQSMLQHPHDEHLQIKLAESQLYAHYNYMLYYPEQDYGQFIYFYQHGNPEQESLDTYLGVIQPWLSYTPESTDKQELLSMIAWLKGESETALALAQQASQKESNLRSVRWLTAMQTHFFQYQAASARLQDYLDQGHALTKDMAKRLIQLYLLQNRWEDALAVSKQTPIGIYAFDFYLNGKCDLLKTLSRHELNLISTEVALCETERPEQLPGSYHARQARAEWLLRHKDYRAALQLLLASSDRDQSTQAWLYQQLGQEQAALAAAQTAFRQTQARLNYEQASFFSHSLTFPLKHRAAEVLFGQQPSLKHARWWLFSAPDRTPVMQASQRLTAAEQAQFLRDAQALQQVEADFGSEIKQIDQVRNPWLVKILAYQTLQRGDTALQPAAKRLLLALDQLKK